MVLDEGKNREVRRLLAQVGHKVLHLRRTALGPLRLGELPPGECRPLKREEVKALREAAEAGVRRPGAGGMEQGAGDEEGEVKAVAVNAAVRKNAIGKELGIEVKDDGPDVRQRRPRGRDQLAAMKSAQKIGEAKAVTPTIPRRPMGERATPEPEGGKGGTVIGAVAGAGAGRKKFGAARGRARTWAAGESCRWPAEAVSRSPGAATMSESPEAVCFADHACFQTVEVVENIRLATDTWRVRFHAPEMARRFVPGQFLMMRLTGYEDPMLGRPFALYDTVLDRAGQLRSASTSSISSWER